MITCEIFKSLKLFYLTWQITTFLGFSIVVVLYCLNLIGDTFFLLSLLFFFICFLISCKDRVQKINFHEKHIEVFYKHKTETIYYVDVKSMKIFEKKDSFWLFYENGKIKVKSRSMSNKEEAMLFIKEKVEKGELNHIQIIYQKSSIREILWGGLIEFLVGLLTIPFVD